VTARKDSLRQLVRQLGRTRSTVLYVISNVKIIFHERKMINVISSI